MRILVVEDQEKIAEFTRKELEESGFSVEACLEGNAAFELATTQDFDAIVLDIMRPGRDGLRILRGLRDRSIATVIFRTVVKSPPNGKPIPRDWPRRLIDASEKKK